MYIGSNARRHVSTPYDEGGLQRGEATFGIEHLWSPSYRRHGPLSTAKPHDAPGLLAPLRVGDRLPWKLEERGEPQ